MSRSRSRRKRDTRKKGRDKMKQPWTLIGISVLIAALSVAAIACGGGKNIADPTATASPQTPSGTQSEVTVNLAEYSMAPAPASVRSGSVKFTAKNIGGTEHEMVILKTDLAPDALPTAADGSVNEDAAGMTVVDEIAEFAAQQEKSLTVSLEAGHYVLLCNVVQKNTDGTTVVHYTKGMVAEFTVTP